MAARRGLIDIRTGRRTLACAIGLTLAIFGLLAPARADFRSALLDYEAKRFEPAFNEFKALAELGHPPSQHNLGVMYFRGEGVTMNRARGYAWIKIAAGAGHSPAIEAEAQFRPLYADDAAALVAEVEAEFGNEALAARLMPKILPNCEYVGFEAPRPVMSSARGLPYPAEARSRGMEGDVQVEFLVGPDGRARDARIVSSLVQKPWEKWLRVARQRLRWEPARLPDGRPVTAVAHILFKFEFADRASGDYSQASRRVDALRRSAEGGDVSAQYFYGLVLATHPEFKKPWSDVLPWLQKAAVAGLPQAQYQLGYSLMKGRGCEPDLQKASRWLELAARNELPDAQVTLARMMLQDRSREGVEKPLHWLRRAADAEDFSGQLELAALYAADPDPAIRNTIQALSLAQTLIKADPRNPLAHEIRAAALASANDFSGAQAAQRQALALAGEFEWDVTAMNERLRTYAAGKAWVGTLLER